MKECRHEFEVGVMARAFGARRSGFYAHEQEGVREQENRNCLEKSAGSTGSIGSGMEAPGSRCNCAKKAGVAVRIGWRG